MVTHERKKIGSLQGELELAGGGDRRSVLAITLEPDPRGKHEEDWRRVAAASSMAKAEVGTKRALLDCIVCVVVYVHIRMM